MYIEFRNRNEFRLNKQELKERIEVFESFFQKDGIYNIFIPTNKPFFEKVMKGEIPKSVYKGVSYNPFITNYGERLENIDFFGWAKRLQEGLPNLNFIVYDAGMYQIINELGDDSLPRRYDKNIAERLLTKLQNELKKNTKIRDNVELRNKYLRAILDAGEVNGEVIDAREVATPDNKEFVDRFQEALEYCRNKSAGNFIIWKFVEYIRYNGEFAKSYSPLVIAEALWLYDTRDNDIKLGPTTERGFDSLIKEAIRNTRDNPYLIVWYSRSNNGIYNYKDNLFFSDEPDIVRKKLSNEGYRDLIDGIIYPFVKEGPLEERVMSFMKKVNSKI